MARIATSNYAGSVSTTFEWATSGGDRFSRELDLYKLSQALENHDHGAGKGLAVSRVANGSIQGVHLAAGAVDATKLSTDAVTAVAVALDAIGALEIANNSVDTAAIQDLAVTNAKIANGTINLATKGTYVPAALTGADFTGTVSAPNIGALGAMSTPTISVSGLLSAALATITAINASSVNTGAFSTSDTNQVANLNASRVANKTPTATPGVAALPLANGAASLDDWVTASAGTPSGNGSFVKTAASIPVGWSRCNGGGAPARMNLDGRMPVGAGTTFSTTFVQDTSYGSSWSFTPAGSVVVVIADNTAANSDIKGITPGETTAAPVTHGHGITSQTFTGTPMSWVIPAYGVVYIQKD